MTTRLFSRRSFVTLLAAGGAGLMFLGATDTVWAQTDPAVEAFLNSIYGAYKGSSDKVRGVPLTSDATIRRYFAPQLADAIIADAAQAKARGEVAKLDRDPFIDGQDWEITRYTMTVKESGPDKAVGNVTINNFGKDILLILDLTKQVEGWRIANIMWERGDTLRGLYFKDEAPPKLDKKPAKKSSTKSSKKPQKRGRKS